MKIEQVNPQDLNEIYRLEKRSFKKDAFSKNTVQRLIIHSDIFLKLIYKNNIIGFIIAIQDEKDRINLINFLVDRKHQRKGYGTLLLENAIERFKKIDGISHVILNVKTSNTSAIELYKRFNFKIIEQIDKYYRQRDPAYLMELQLFP